MSTAYFTLVTSDSYVAGALVLACSLKKHHATADINVLVVRDSISESSHRALVKHFTKVIDVGLIRSTELRNLNLLGRNELDVTWTKIHVFNPNVIGSYAKAAFLDADTLVTQNLDSIFDYVDPNGPVFAAAPDIGWPDCFNSGVFVFRPSYDLFNELATHLKFSGSFDGGDQGFLNSFFCNWPLDSTRHDPTRHRTDRLPFTYNVTPSSYYTYLPAFEAFRHDIRLVHFIGSLKPWHYDRFSDGRVASNDPAALKQYTDMVQTWWSIFDEFNIASDGFSDRVNEWNRPSDEQKKEKEIIHHHQELPRSEFMPPQQTPVYHQPQEKPQEAPVHLDKPQPPVNVGHHKATQSPAVHQNRSGHIYAPTPHSRVRFHTDGSRKSHSRSPTKHHHAHAAYDFTFAQAPGRLPPSPPALPQITPHHTAYIPPSNHYNDYSHHHTGQAPANLSEFKFGWDHREVVAKSPEKSPVKSFNHYNFDESLWRSKPETKSVPSTSAKLSLEKDVALQARTLSLDFEDEKSADHASRQAEAGVNLLLGLTDAIHEYNTIMRKPSKKEKEKQQIASVYPKIKSIGKSEGLAWGLTGGTGKYEKMMQGQERWFRDEPEYVVESVSSESQSPEKKSPQKDVSSVPVNSSPNRNENSNNSATSTPSRSDIPLVPSNVKSPVKPVIYRQKSPQKIETVIVPVPEPKKFHEISPSAVGTPAYIENVQYTVPSKPSKPENILYAPPSAGDSSKFETVTEATYSEMLHLPRSTNPQISSVLAISEISAVKTDMIVSTKAENDIRNEKFDVSQYSFGPKKDLHLKNSRVVEVTGDGLPKFSDKNQVTESPVKPQDAPTISNNKKEAVNEIPVESSDILTTSKNIIPKEKSGDEKAAAKSEISTAPKEPEIESPVPEVVPAIAPSTTDNDIDSVIQLSGRDSPTNFEVKESKYVPGFEDQIDSGSHLELIDSRVISSQDTSQVLEEGFFSADEIPPQSSDEDLIYQTPPSFATSSPERFIEKIEAKNKLDSKEEILNSEIEKLKITMSASDSESKGKPKKKKNKKKKKKAANVIKETAKANETSALDSNLGGSKDSLGKRSGKKSDSVTNRLGQMIDKFWGALE